MKALRAQVAAEVAMTLRRGETLLLTLGIPLLLLVFFSEVKITTSQGNHPVDLVTPGILALAVMSTSMVSLGIATGFERGYGVLKRLGATPLGRGRLLTAKVLSVILIEILQGIVIVTVGLALGWNPSGGLIGAVQALLACLLGSVAFGGIGLAMAGRSLSGAPAPRGHGCATFRTSRRSSFCCPSASGCSTFERSPRRSWPHCWLQRLLGGAGRVDRSHSPTCAWSLPLRRGLSGLCR